MFATLMAVHGAVHVHGAVRHHLPGMDGFISEQLLPA